ncbi:uncharacterized protein Bfra_010940, partial [Botrytis fragariae]
LRAPTTCSVSVLWHLVGWWYRNSSPNNFQGYNLIGYEQTTWASNSISPKIQITNLSRFFWPILIRASVVPTPSTEFEPWGARKYIPGTRVTGSYWSVLLPVLHIFIGSVREPQKLQTLFLLRVQSGSKRN